ncbi:hypothetical protein ACLOJK_017956 [Asimina triloba]
MDLDSFPSKLPFLLSRQLISFLPDVGNNFQHSPPDFLSPSILGLCFLLHQRRLKRWQFPHQPLFNSITSARNKYCNLPILLLGNPIQRLHCRIGKRLDFEEKPKEKPKTWQPKNIKTRGEASGSKVGLETEDNTVLSNVILSIIPEESNFKQNDVVIEGSSDIDLVTRVAMIET